MKDPEPQAAIKTVGDSNIVLTFYGWIDQKRADFLRARSVAIRAAKLAIEAAGFTLPEPIYRLRIDELPKTGRPEASVAERTKDRARESEPTAGVESSVAPEDHLDEKIDAERRATNGENLLNARRPIE